jgi:hypothetical protein
MGKTPNLVMFDKSALDMDICDLVQMNNST